MIDRFLQPVEKITIELLNANLVLFDNQHVYLKDIFNEEIGGLLNIFADAQDNVLMRLTISEEDYWEISKVEFTEMLMNGVIVEISFDTVATVEDHRDEAGKVN